jgi:hypothetical protein
MTVQVSEPKSGTNASDNSSDISSSQPHLAKQDASTVEPSKLTALSPEVVSEVA